MKKHILLVVLFSLILVGCAPRSLDNVAKDGSTVYEVNKIDINTIADLFTLQVIIKQVSMAINSGTLSIDEAQKMVEQLQNKYISLINTTNGTIEDTFDSIQKKITTQTTHSYTLPLRAKKLGMIQPEGMKLNILQSKYVYETGYDSTILVYTGDYDIALQQAKIIAQQAHLQVSKNFRQAQSIAQVGNVDYISGLDISGLSRGIIYVNHELLDSDVDQMLSVSVDQEGTLTIEATNYKE